MNLEHVRKRVINQGKIKTLKQECDGKLTLLLVSSVKWKKAALSREEKFLSNGDFDWMMVWNVSEFFFFTLLLVKWSELWNTLKRCFVHHFEDKILYGHFEDKIQYGLLSYKGVNLNSDTSCIVSYCCYEKLPQNCLRMHNFIILWFWSLTQCSWG